jgi:ligand-binding sensor domain-containing protein
LRRTILLYLLLTGTGYFAGAQPWVFEILDASSGLPSSECISLTQDHTGHLWIGTTVGLSRYDGYTFENFSTSFDGERFGKVNVVREDDRHYLWIGTDAGLFVRTPEGKFTKVGTNETGSQSITDLVIADEELFLASEIGPLHLSRNKIIGTKRLMKVSLPDFILPEWRSLPPMRLQFMARAQDGTLYIAGIHTVFRYRNHHFEKLLETTQSNDQISTLVPVDSALLYAYTTMEHFHKINGTSVTELFVKETLTEHHRKKAVVILRAMGMFEFDPESETITARIDVAKEGILWSTQCMKDDAGIYWIASHDGLVKIKRSPFNYLPFKHLSAYPEVYSMMQTPRGDFYIGSNRGIIFQKTEEKIAQLKDVNPNAEVFDMREDSTGTVWYATGYEGIVRQRNGELTRYTKADGLHDNSTNSFFSTSGGRLFVTGDKGVTEIIEQNGGVRLKAYRFTTKTKTQFATFYDGVESPDGTVWVAGQEGVARIVDDSLIHYPLGGEYIEVAAMVQDGGDSLWLAVNGRGLWRCYFNQKSELVVHREINETGGLPVSVFSSLYTDRQRNLWVCHYQGISVLTHGDRKFLNFDQQDGWPFKNYNKLFLFQDDRHRFWAGCSKGLAWFDAEGLLKVTTKPRIFLTARSSDSQLISQDASLAYTVRKVAFSYHAIDAANQKRLQYFYRLEGLQSDWLVAGENRDVTFDQLPPGTYTFRVRAHNNKGGVSETATLTFIIEKPFWQTAWFIGVCLVAMATLIYLIMRAREHYIRKNEQRMKATEIELLSLSNALSKSKLVALRSQMNPHFIFNALNSIQQFVLQGNADDANRYLAQFARLQRDILNSCDQDFIALEKEIEMLNHYLQIEQLRSNKNFQFSISVNEGIDAEEVKIPPMLIQPFVENAIWHGLQLREGEKLVSIHFSPDGRDLLSCVIEDNGIGRMAALENRRRNNHHQYADESKGIKLIGDRMSLLRQQYRRSFDVSIEDITNEKGTVLGTRVKVSFPMDVL